jgi:dTDP-4-dehydrorhamnose 3,5-epimerase
MIFRDTRLKGVFEVDLERIEDERGFFARSYCKREFNEHSIDLEIAQSSISFNRRKGTLRGIHFQAAPLEEKKLVSCARGAIYDVIIDLRPNSSTYTQWIATELTALNDRSVYIPEGCAHGFQTLEDNALVTYHISAFYVPRLARGVRWDDPAFSVKWPYEPPPVISEKDASYVDFLK